MIDSISQSMLNTASRCGEQFRRRYMEGDIIPPPVAAARGTAVHKSASLNHHTIKDTGAALPKSDIQDAAATAYMETIREGVSMTPEEEANKVKVLGEGKDQAVSLAGLYSDAVSPRVHEPILIEERLTADIGLAVPLAGTVDLLHSGTKILDLKTSSSRKPESFGVSNLQAMTYRHLVKESQGIEPDVEFSFLVTNKTPVEQTIRAVVAETDLAAVQARAAMLLKMIQTGVFPPANPSDWICSRDWCGFYSTCPYVSNPVSVQITETIHA